MFSPTTIDEIEIEIKPKRQQGEIKQHTSLVTSRQLRNHKLENTQNE